MEKIGAMCVTGDSSSLLMEPRKKKTTIGSNRHSPFSNVRIVHEQLTRSSSTVSRSLEGCPKLLMASTNLV